MKNDVYLICLAEPDKEIFDAVRKEWPDDHYEINETQMLFATSNGGGESEYDRIHAQLELEEDEKFVALIVGVDSTHGYHNRGLWKWLRAHGDE